MNKQSKQKAIIAHGENLKAIFKVDIAPIELVKKLHRLEVTAQRLTLEACNIGVPDAEYEERENKILLSVDKLLGFIDKKIPVFVNGDPRGYALKIESEYCHTLNIHRDFAGYGILAPELK